MGTRTYAYDTFGNLTSLGGTAIAVDHTTNRLAGGAVYDARGNMTDQPMGTWTRRLRWDEENRLLAVRAQGAGAPLGIWAFAYDHNGERVLKYRIDAGAVAEAELYLRDEAGNVLTELDWVDTGAGGYWARAKDHVYLGRDLIGSFDYTDGAPHVVSYARDHLGTQRAEVWGLGTATTTDLWPYGAVASTKLSGDAPPLANGAHLFTGHERDFVGTEADPLQGLDYMHARYYSHDLGRFLSVDPVEGSVGSSQSWDRYAYVLGNPLRMVDPSGKGDSDTVECHVGESCASAIKKKNSEKEFEKMMAEEKAKSREIDEILKRAEESNRRAAEIFKGIQAAGNTAQTNAPSTHGGSGLVLSLTVAANVGAGARGGGGTSLNVGVSGDGGFSFSITGSAGGGIETGGGATIEAGLAAYPGAPSVFSLNGSSVDSGLSLAIAGGGSFHMTTNTSGDPKGFGLAVAVGGRAGTEAGASAYSTLNTTSTLLGWGSRRGFVLFASE